MPFTPSHAIVALPFLRTPLVPAAIAVGAMTPDLPLFTRGLVIDYPTTHDLRWLPVTVALALVLLLIWRLLLRPACRRLAPRFVGARLPVSWDRGVAATLAETFGSVGRTALLLLALALGVTSHILWDAFTHEGRFGSELIPVLAEAWGPLTGYKWLQYASGAGGVIVLALAAARWLRHRDPGAVDSAAFGLRLTWWLSLPALLGAAALAGWVAYGPFTDDFGVRHLAYRTLPPTCGVWATLTVVLVLVLRIRAGRRLDRRRAS